MPKELLDKIFLRLKERGDFYGVTGHDNYVKDHCAEIAMVELFTHLTESAGDEFPEGDIRHAANKLTWPMMRDMVSRGQAYEWAVQTGKEAWSLRTAEVQALKAKVEEAIEKYSRVVDEKMKPVDQAIEARDRIAELERENAELKEHKNILVSLGLAQELAEKTAALELAKDIINRASPDEHHAYCYLQELEALKGGEGEWVNLHAHKTEVPLIFLRASS